MALTNVKTGEITYEGLVLRTGTNIDSLWERDTHYAIVLDGSETKRVDTGGRMWGGGGWTDFRVAVDATVAAVEEAVADLVENRVRAAMWDSLEEARRVVKGKVVRVVRGRKVAKDTVGEVIWTGESRYGERVGVKDAGGLVHWTAQSNVEVDCLLDYVGDAAEIRATETAIVRREWAEDLAAAGQRDAGRDPFRAAIERAVTSAILVEPVAEVEEAYSGLGEADFGNPNDPSARGYDDFVNDDEYEAPYDSNIGCPAPGVRVEIVRRDLGWGEGRPNLDLPFGSVGDGYVAEVVEAEHAVLDEPATSAAASSGALDLAMALRGLLTDRKTRMFLSMHNRTLLDQAEQAMRRAGYVIDPSEVQ